MWEVTDRVNAWTNNKSTVEEAENWVELPLQCITFILEGDLLALLLLIHKQTKTDIQESSTSIFDIFFGKKKNKGFFDAHFKGLV